MCLGKRSPNLSIHSTLFKDFFYLNNMMILKSIDLFGLPLPVAITMT